MSISEKILHRRLEENKAIGSNNNNKSIKIERKKKIWRDVEMKKQKWED